MKNTIFLLLILATVSVYSQNTEYKVFSYLTEGTKASNTHYLGEAWLNAIIQDDEELGYNITKLPKQLLKPTQPWTGINMVLRKS